MDEMEWSQAALEAMQVWQKIETFEGLCELNARFMEGKIRFIPGCSGEGLDAESEPIDYLKLLTWAGDAALDEAGLVVDMQGYEAVCSDSAMQDLRQTWFVSIIDLCWGRTGYLWDTLAKEISFPVEPPRYD